MLIRSQSILEKTTEIDLTDVTQHAKNNAGLRGAQVSNYLINMCFGFGSLFILAFLIAAGMKMMHVWTIRMWKWFVSCSLLMIWFSLFLGFAFMDFYQDSSILWGGLHGYNVSNWFVAQIGEVGLWLFLLGTALCLAIFLNKRVVDWLRQLFSFNYLKRAKKAEVNTPAGPTEAPAVAESEIIMPMTAVAEETSIELELPLDDEEEITGHLPIPAEEDMELPLQYETPVAEETKKVEPLDVPNEPVFNIEAPIDTEEDFVGNDTEPYNPKLDLQSYKIGRAHV